MAVVNGTRFGDEHSTLLDEFERLSIEAHAAKLNRVMLGRSLSEPKLMQKSQSILIDVPPFPLVTQVMHGPGGSRHHHGGGGGGFHQVLKKLLKPILGRKKRARSKQQVEDHNKDLSSFKVFSTSLRF